MRFFRSVHQESSFLLFQLEEGYVVIYFDYRMQQKWLCANTQPWAYHTLQSSLLCDFFLTQTLVIELGNETTRITTMLSLIGVANWKNLAKMYRSDLKVICTWQRHIKNSMWDKNCAAELNLHCHELNKLLTDTVPSELIILYCLPLALWHLTYRSRIQDPKT